MREIGAVLRAALAGAFPVVVCEGSRVRGARQRRRPNVLLITTDEERQSFPHLDGFTLPAREWLQERGTTFDRHYDSSAMCSSSRSVMYTGRHVPVTQIYDNYDMPYIRPLDPELKTLGSLIQAAGYYTAYQGKWHLSNAYRSPDRPRSTAAAQQPYWFTDFNHWVISTRCVGWPQARPAVGEDLRSGHTPWVALAGFCCWAGHAGVTNCGPMPLQTNLPSASASPATDHKVGNGQSARRVDEGQCQGPAGLRASDVGRRPLREVREGPDPQPDVDRGNREDDGPL